MAQAVAAVENTMGRGDVARGAVDFPYMVIKMFTEYGNAARKPLAPSGVQELMGFWNRLQELVANQELSIAAARRCATAAGREAALLSGSEPTIRKEHVREANRLVRSRQTATAGLLCR